MTSQQISLAFLTAVCLLALLSCSNAAVPEDEVFRSLGIQPVDTDLPTPGIEFTDSSGKSLSLADFQDTVVLLNFWASWCPPCRAEMPSMDRLSQELGDREFSMVAINVGEPESLVESFVKEFGIGFPVYTDPESRAAAEFGISALPTSILLDRSGTVRAVVTGALEWDDAEILAMLKDWTR